MHFLGVMVLVSLTLAIARQISSRPKGLYLDYAEAFQNLNPADASLEKPLDPYAILADTLQPKQTPGNLTAETCYQADFLAQSNKTGNMIQRTNNIRHLGPDSCSAPLTELVNSFYVQS